MIVRGGCGGGAAAADYDDDDDDDYGDDDDHNDDDDHDADAGDNEGRGGPVVLQFRDRHPCVQKHSPCGPVRFVHRGDRHIGGPLHQHQRFQQYRRHLCV